MTPENQLVFLVAAVDKAERERDEALALLREHGEYARAGDWCGRRDAFLARVDAALAGEEDQG